MAQLLREKHSTKVHLNISRRHMRLCKQIKGCEKYATAIDPFYKDLTEKQTATELVRHEKESAHDLVTLYDKDLDNDVITLFEKCKQYDRGNPGRPVLNQLFTDGKLTTITSASYDSEPDVALQLLTRLAALGPDHVLSSQSQSIKTNIDRCKGTLSAYYDSITILKSAEANEEISKSKLRRQYEFNYLDSVKEFGKSFAERLFPVISSKSKSSGDEAETKENNDTKTEKP
jgi:hypothetical protein